MTHIFKHIRKIIYKMYLLGFGFVECVDLVAEVSNDGVVLLPEIGQGALVVQRPVLILLLQFGQLGLSLTVQLNLEVPGM